MLKKLTWLTTPFILLFSQTLLAANVTCTIASVANYEKTSGTISDFNYSQTINDNRNIGGLVNCLQYMAVRSNFKASTGNTNLTATGSDSYSFGVDTNLVISNSNASTAVQDLAKIWLSENLKLSFDVRDDARYRPVAKIEALDTDYNIHPNTSQPGRTTIAGEVYLIGATGLMNARFHIPTMRYALIDLTKPSSEIIDALNGASIRIHLGTMEYKYDNYYLPSPPTGIPSTASIEVFMNLTLNFTRPTCTMANQSVILEPVPTSVLKQQQVSNAVETNFIVNCTTSMNNKVLLATISDSFLSSNKNGNGILKNNPTLPNRSNVDIQLMDVDQSPLAIGEQTSLYAVPENINTTRLSVPFNIRYFRSEPTATPGYVQTQATVRLDYQ